MTPTCEAEGCTEPVCHPLDYLCEYHRGCEDEQLALEAKHLAQSREEARGQE